MKEKISAIVSFSSALGWFFFGLAIFSEGNIQEKADFFILFAIITASISTMLYVIWTKFGGIERTELDKLDYNNQILKKQIEQQELLNKLNK